jgi:hypothetical protein
VRIVALAVALPLAAFVLFACTGGSTSPTPFPPLATATPTAVASATPVGEFITIDRPDANETVDVPIHASGTADVFEAALIVEAQDMSGHTLCVRHIMATSGTGTPGTGRRPWPSGRPVRLRRRCSGRTR